MDCEKKSLAAIVTDNGKIVCIHFEENVMLSQMRDTVREIYGVYDNNPSRSATIFEIGQDEITTSGRLLGGIRDCQISLSLVNGERL